jgi:protein TonB
MDARDAAFACAVHGMVACALLLWPAARMAEEPPRVYRVRFAALPSPVQAAPEPVAAPGPAAPPEPVEPVAPPPQPASPPPTPAAQPQAPRPAKPARPVEPKRISQRKTTAAAPDRPAEPEADRPAAPAAASVAPAPGVASPAPGAAGQGSGRPAMGSLGGLAGYDADAVDVRPTVVRKVLPVYPPQARRLHLAGRVTLRILIDADGAPRSFAVHQASPAGVFEEAALEAARQFRFTPGRIDGKGVATIVLLPFTFEQAN